MLIENAATSFSKARARWLIRCFSSRVDLAEGLGVAVRDENRVVAEALVAARRPSQAPVHLAAEQRDLAVGLG